jgi:hypothetical protein
MNKIITALSIMTVLLMLKINETYIPNRIVRSEPTELEKFLNHMAERESDNIPHAVNPYGMLGKYQFAPSTIRILGFRVSEQQFLSNPELQDSVMVAYLRSNNKELNTLITKYENKKFKGVRVTRSGVLAAAHLCGSGNIKKFFTNPYYEGCSDANDTNAREYMRTFSIYNLKRI